MARLFKLEHTLYAKTVIFKFGQKNYRVKKIVLRFRTKSIKMLINLKT
jgi:hypothetical protein